MSAIWDNMSPLSQGLCLVGVWAMLAMASVGWVKFVWRVVK